jgi:LytS/YehU family sensor histidine kinase
MILQPLVENAIRYGVASAREGGWVEVAATACDGTLNIHVRNNVGSDISNGTGVGLRNAEARLKFLYSGDATLRLTLGDDGTATVRLTLPALNPQSAELTLPRVDAGFRRKNSLCAFSSSTMNR